MRVITFCPPPPNIAPRKKLPQPIYSFLFSAELKASFLCTSQIYRLSFCSFSNTTLSVIHILNVKRPHEIWRWSEREWSTKIKPYNLGKGSGRLQQVRPTPQSISGHPAFRYKFFHFLRFFASYSKAAAACSSSFFSPSPEEQRVQARKHRRTIEHIGKKSIYTYLLL